MMFTFVNYTVITCYVPRVGYNEPRLCLLVKNKGWSEQSPSRQQQQHGLWRGQKKHPVVCQPGSHPFPSANNCFKCSSREVLVLLGSNEADCVCRSSLVSQEDQGGKVALLGVDLGHGLTKFSGPTFGLGMERKAVRVFNHFACEAKAWEEVFFPSVWNVSSCCVFMDFVKTPQNPDISSYSFPCRISSTKPYNTKQWMSFTQTFENAFPLFSSIICLGKFY